jgi:hypothetical protein
MTLARPLRTVTALSASSTERLPSLAAFANLPGAATILVDELDAGNLNRRSDLHRRAKNRIS